MEINKIHNVDCIEGIRNLSDCSVDSVITDPPYNINLIPKRGLTNSIENDNLSDDDFKYLLGSVFNEVDRVLKDNSFLVVFTGWSSIPLFRGVLDRLFTLKSMPVWVKNNFGIGYYTRPQYEPCFLYTKGNPKPLIRPVSDVWHFKKVVCPTHSCQKPVELMRFIVKAFTKKGDFVLDPFAGVGSTLVACNHLERDFIGFEINNGYCEIARKRLQQETLRTFL